GDAGRERRHDLRPPRPDHPANWYCPLLIDRDLPDRSRNSAADRAESARWRMVLRARKLTARRPQRQIANPARLEALSHCFISFPPFEVRDR
ncbi:hypothetical protein, partial [Dermacoccus nishinomiyaensis]|uniref:hypothetical protein n=1 Tax=Dermacoccus nishinomiyaensis TaxID=1274 RepID=UPI00248EB037